MCVPGPLSCGAAPARPVACRVRGSCSPSRRRRHGLAQAPGARRTAAVEAELAVVVVLDDQAAVRPGPAHQLVAPLAGQRDAHRELVGGDHHGRAADAGYPDADPAPTGTPVNASPAPAAIPRNIGEEGSSNAMSPTPCSRSIVARSDIPCEKPAHSTTQSDSAITPRARATYLATAARAASGPRPRRSRNPAPERT